MAMSWRQAVALFAVAAVAMAVLLWQPWRVGIRRDDIGPYNVVDVAAPRDVDAATVAIEQRRGRVIERLSATELRPEPVLRAVFDVTSRRDALAVVEDLRREGFSAWPALTERLHRRR